MTTLALPLATDRLTLRLFTTDDADDLYAYQSLPDVARYLYRPPLDREECARTLERRAAGVAWTENGDSLALAVCRTGEPGVLGEVSLKLADARARQVEAGWTFHPDAGGRGYATEAARAVVSLAFDALGAHRVFARLDVLNTGSVGVCERLGMRREAHLVENDLDGERWGSEYVYATLAHEWKR
ncbi:GNAT family N-acetyltransferase [Streptomyces sp. NPDC001941]|uniref:GNAT family N-acetyltransferase n=1 Tax=Streptomyces sp. NPDC001941 TaxID=3154659 RepID=UPI00331C4857